MKEISFCNSSIRAVVDDTDYDRVMRLNWTIARDKSGNGFMICSTTAPRVILARFILCVYDSKILVDHKDHNSLNNCKYNLRAATKSQNLQNSRKLNKSAASKFKGVSLAGSNYRARITLNSKTIELGCYFTEEGAAKAYDTAALKYFGEFANLNFPLEAKND